MILSKKVIGAAIVALSIFTLAPAHGEAVRSGAAYVQPQAAASGLGLGLELIGVSKTPAGSFVILQDSKTGKKGVYKRGSVVRGAKITEVKAEEVVFEKDGAREVVTLRKSAKVEGSPASVPAEAMGVPAGVPPAPYPALTDPSDPSLFTFEPVTNETGPVAEGGPAPELPYFEPITNDTGPVAPPGEEPEAKELPEFTPMESMTGPVAE